MVSEWVRKNQNATPFVTARNELTWSTLLVMKMAVSKKFSPPLPRYMCLEVPKKNHEKNLKIVQVMPLLKITDFLQNFPPDISGRRAIFSLKAL